MRISSVAFAHADSILVSASFWEDSVRTWNVEDWTLLHNIQVHGVTSVATSFHHPFIVPFGSGSQNASVWDAKQGGHWDLSQAARSASFKQGGTSFIISGQGGELATWDLPTLLEHQDKTSTGEDPPLDQEPKLVGTTANSPQAGAVFNRCNGDIDAVIGQSSIRSLSLSLDGQIAASGSFKNDLVLWDLAAGQPVMRMQGEKFNEVFLNTKILRVYHINTWNT